MGSTPRPWTIVERDVAMPSIRWRLLDEHMLTVADCSTKERAEWLLSIINHHDALVEFVRKIAGDTDDRASPGLQDQAAALLAAIDKDGGA